MSSFTTTYYVNSYDGNDNNPGTKEQPFKTLERAAQLELDDNVHISATIVVPN